LFNAGYIIYISEIIIVSMSYQLLRCTRSCLLAVARGNSFLHSVPATRLSSAIDIDEICPNSFSKLTPKLRFDDKIKRITKITGNALSALFFVSTFHHTETDRAFWQPGVLTTS
jgi:hypothetical protein